MYIVLPSRFSYTLTNFRGERQRLLGLVTVVGGTLVGQPDAGGLLSSNDVTDSLVASDALNGVTFVVGGDEITDSLDDNVLGTLTSEMLLLEVPSCLIGLE